MSGRNGVTDRPLTFDRILHQKVVAIRPDAALRPGAVMVGILMPDKTPGDQIGNGDILWIKCPGSKTIVTVLKAFK